MHAVILERNKLVGRKVGRLFMATGATALCLEDPAQVAGSLAGADVLCADAFDADLVAELLRANPRMKGVLWTAEPLRRALKYMMECPSINNVLGRRDFESPPRAWEVVMIARRFAGQMRDELILADAVILRWERKRHDEAPEAERARMMADILKSKLEYEPAEPTSSQVVTPERAATGSASIPQ